MHRNAHQIFRIVIQVAQEVLKLVRNPCEIWTGIQRKTFHGLQMHARDS